LSQEILANPVVLLVLVIQAVQWHLGFLEILEHQLNQEYPWNLYHPLFQRLQQDLADLKFIKNQ